MGHKKVSSEPYYPDVIRESHKCSGCQQLQAELDKVKEANMQLWKELDEHAKFVYNQTILATPTGELRNKLTELNILRMQILKENRV